MTFESNLLGFLYGPGPQGEPALPDAPPMPEWVGQHSAVLWHLDRYMLFKAGHPVPPLPLDEEPYSTWEQDFPNDAPADMIAKGHVALYP